MVSDPSRCAYAMISSMRLVSSKYDAPIVSLEGSSATAALLRAAAFMMMLEDSDGEAVDPMPMQARRGQLVIPRDLGRRCTARQPTIDLRALRIVACSA